MGGEGQDEVAKESSQGESNAAGRGGRPARASDGRAAPGRRAPPLLSALALPPSCHAGRARMRSSRTRTAESKRSACRSPALLARGRCTAAERKARRDEDEQQRRGKKARRAVRPALSARSGWLPRPARSLPSRASLLPAPGSARSPAGLARHTTQTGRAQSPGRRDGLCS